MRFNRTAVGLALAAVVLATLWRTASLASGVDVQGFLFLMVSGAILALVSFFLVTRTERISGDGTRSARPHEKWSTPAESNPNSGSGSTGPHKRPAPEVPQRVLSMLLVNLGIAFVLLLFLPSALVAGYVLCMAVLIAGQVLSLRA
jgi:hypothetical protein